MLPRVIELIRMQTSNIRDTLITQFAVVTSKSRGGNKELDQSTSNIGRGIETDREPIETLIRFISPINPELARDLESILRAAGMSMNTQSPNYQTLLFLENCAAKLCTSRISESVETLIGALPVEVINSAATSLKNNSSLTAYTNPTDNDPNSRTASRDFQRYLNDLNPLVSEFFSKIFILAGKSFDGNIPQSLFEAEARASEKFKFSLETYTESFKQASQNTEVIQSALLFFKSYTTRKRLTETNWDDNQSIAGGAFVEREVANALVLYVADLVSSEVARRITNIFAAVDLTFDHESRGYKRLIAVEKTVFELLSRSQTANDLFKQYLS